MVVIRTFWMESLDLISTFLASSVTSLECSLVLRCSIWKSTAFKYFLISSGVYFYHGWSLIIGIQVVLFFNDEGDFVLSYFLPEAFIKKWFWINCIISLISLKNHFSLQYRDSVAHYINNKSSSELDRILLYIQGNFDRIKQNSYGGKKYR